MRSMKAKQPSLRRSLAKTINMYTNPDNPTQPATQPRNLPLNSTPILHKNTSKNQSLNNANQHKSQILIDKYKILIENMQSYRVRVQEQLAKELAKNQTHYLAMMRVLERYRIESRNWLREKINETNEIINEKMLRLQTKLYQIGNAQHLKSLEKELSEYEESRIMEIPVFKVEEINMSKYKDLIKQFCIIPNLECTQATYPTTLYHSSKSKLDIKCSKPSLKESKQGQQSVENVKEQPKKEPPRMYKNDETVKKEGKLIAPVSEFDLMCQEDIDEWNRRSRKEQQKRYLLTSEVIIEQSESQEDSIIYNAQL